MWDAETITNTCEQFLAPCWTSDKEVNGSKVSACKYNIEALKKDGINGISPVGHPSHTCACPPGFQGDGINKISGCHSASHRLMKINK